MQHFMIPCDFGGRKAPFPIYVGQPKDDSHPLHHQAWWLSSERGGSIPQEVMDSFEKLHKIAMENNVSFEELCVYAMGEAMGGQQQENAATQQQEHDDPSLGSGGMPMMPPPPPLDAPEPPKPRMPDDEKQFANDMHKRSESHQENAAAEEQEASVQNNNRHNQN